MRMKNPVSIDSCPAGYTLYPEPNTDPDWCVRPIGTPVTITSAAVSSLSSFQPSPPPGQQAGPAQYQLTIILPAADVPALTAVSTTAADVHGPLSITVAGRTWLLPTVEQPLTSRDLLIPMPSKNQALELQGLLVASG